MGQTKEINTKRCGRKSLTELVARTELKFVHRRPEQSSGIFVIFVILRLDFEKRITSTLGIFMEIALIERSGDSPKKTVRVAKRLTVKAAIEVLRLQRTTISIIQCYGDSVVGAEHA